MTPIGHASIHSNSRPWYAADGSTRLANCRTMGSITGNSYRNRLSGPLGRVLHRADIRCLGILHALDVIAGVDVVHLSGHPAREIRQQVEARRTYLLDGDGAAQGRIVFVPLQYVAEV